MKLAGMLLMAVAAQACALESNDASVSAATDGPSHGASVPQSAEGPRCERLDDFGLAASGILLSASTSQALDAPCVDLSGDRIETFAGRACQLVAPTGFALEGCRDSYDCGGCPLELRSDDDYGFVAVGTSSEPACADMNGKYALVTALACGSNFGHIDP